MRKNKIAVCAEQKIIMGLLTHPSATAAVWWVVHDTALQRPGLSAHFFRSLRVAVLLEFGFNATLICLFPGNELNFRCGFRCGGLIWKGL